VSNPMLYAHPGKTELQYAGQGAAVGKRKIVSELQPWPHSNLILGPRWPIIILSRRPYKEALVTAFGASAVI
jgi:hypothetical protein